MISPSALETCPLTIFPVFRLMNCRCGFGRMPNCSASCAICVGEEACATCWVSNCSCLARLAFCCCRLVIRYDPWARVVLMTSSETKAQGSYRITNLQQQNANLAKQEQLLTQQVAQASSPSQIAQEAEQLGMRPNSQLQFINLKTGKVVKGQVSKADAEINVPGYTP